MRVRTAIAATHRKKSMFVDFRGFRSSLWIRVGFFCDRIRRFEILAPAKSTTENLEMKYFSIYIPDEVTNCQGQSPEQQQAMQKFVGDAIARGEFIQGGGFLSLVELGVVMRRVNGETRVIDGPYAESKELIGGFAMLDYATREAAVEGARRFLDVAGDGECMTYQIAEGPHPDSA
jgi:hypothetical protein